MIQGMKILTSILFSLSLLFTLVSCTYDPDAIPNNTINSPNGLVIDLEWYTGGSVAQSTSEADLDLILTTNSEFVEASETAEYEQVRIENFYRDGSYIISVLYFAGNVDLDFSLYARGTNSSDNIVVQNSFLLEDEGVLVDIMEVVKSGTSYRVIPL